MIAAAFDGEMAECTYTGVHILLFQLAERQVALFFAAANGALQPALNK